MKLLTVSGTFSLILILNLTLCSDVRAQAWASTSNGGLWFYNNVGIGTSNPQAGLHVSGMHIATTSPDLSSFIYLVNNQQVVWNAGDVNGLMFATATNLSLNGYSEKVRFTNDGCVCIGNTVSNGYKLNVNGSARINQVVVNSNGADYVFDSSYHLPRLSEVKAYVEKNHHLEGIASAEEMSKKGLDLGDNQTQLLRKIEELTLYVIDLDKKQDTIIKQDEQLRCDNARLQEEIEALKRQRHERSR